MLKFRVLSFKGGHDAWDSWPEMKTDLINWVTLVKLCWPNVTRATVIVIKSCRKKSRRETRNGRSTPTRKNLQYKLPLALFHPLKRYAGNIQWMGIFLKWSDRGAKRRDCENISLLWVHWMSALMWAHYCEYTNVSALIWVHFCECINECALMWVH